MATTITGASGADTITGLAGNDTLNGGGGNDTYIVNSFLNTIVELLPTGYVIGGTAAYGGIDTIKTSVLDSAKTFSLDNYAYIENLTYTGTVAAQLKGNSLDNQIKANSATITNDTLYGGEGNDFLAGYDGADLLQGGTGNDTLDGGSGKDTLVGGSGNDTYMVSDFDVVLETSYTGFDTVVVTEAGGRYLDLRSSVALNLEGLTYNSTVSNKLSGNDVSNFIESKAASGNDTIDGWGGNDILKGGGGNDLISGGIGNDDLYGEAGADTLNGGVGNDIYYVDTTDTIQENTKEGTDTLIGTVTSINTTAFSTTIENLIYTGTTDSALQGNDMANLIAGGKGNNTMSADAGDDTLIGGGGADVLQGGAGNDFLYGGIVNNIQSRTFIYGMSSPSTLDDAAADTLTGGTGSDTYYLDNTQDTIVEVATDTGVDVIRSSVDISLTTYNNIEGLVLSDDVAAGSTSRAWFAEGNVDSNIIIGNSSENYISGGAGNDYLSGGVGTSYVYDGSSAITDVVDGGDGDDNLLADRTAGYYITSDIDILLGGAGNDFYIVDNENTFINDSAGTDTVYLTTSLSLAGDSGVEVIVLAGGNSTYDTQAQAVRAKFATVQASKSNSVYYQAYSATGNDLNNTIYGNSNDNQLDGGAGNDSLLGGDGNDTLIGGAGTDTLIGGNGNDVYEIDASDVITEAANGGIDIIHSATLTNYTGYANIEGLEYTGTRNVVLRNGTSNITADIFTGGSGNDTIEGWDGNDTLSGGDGNDSILGGAGNDRLTGGAGQNTLNGGDGNDSIVSYGSDSILGGTGNDSIYVHGSQETVSGGYGNDYIDGDYYSTSGLLLQGDAGNDTIFGSNANDTLIGGDGNDVIYSYGVNDSILGGTGNDSIYVRGSQETVSGGDGNDYIDVYYYSKSGLLLLQGDAGNDTIDGSSGNDTLTGGDDSDYIWGEYGDDVIYLGGSVVNNSSYYNTTAGDTVFGGVGTDVFKFEASSAYAATTFSSGSTYFTNGSYIGDFLSGTDKIQFAKAMTGNGDGTLDNVTQVAATATSFAKSSELVIFAKDAVANFDNYNYYYYGDFNSISATEVTSVITSADAAFAIGDQRLFVIDDGHNSAIFQFTSANADAVVTANEIKLVGVINDNATLTASDFGLY